MSRLTHYLAIYKLCRDGGVFKLIAALKKGDLKMRSWKTSGMGVGAILGIMGYVLPLITDGDPNTNPDWKYVIMGIVGGITAMLAKDYNVTGTKEQLRETLNEPSLPK